ncbi:Apyrase [Dictyocaulus viviparus]|uniref:Apyrase n=1 Tax=Dictyocaulus viviparus TaxID=29172 RepID=A0A0D8XV19_DICVI|nr:Apyrase [Dictyocaulus viviparus]
MTEYYNHLSVLVNATKMKALLLLMLQTFVTVETNLFGVLEKVFGSDRKSKTDDDWLYPTFEGDDKIPPRTYNTTKFGNGTEIYRLLVVTDMDKFAKTATDWTWRAVTREGRLQLVKDHETLRNVTITWKRGSDRNLTTQLNMKGRAMELSDLLEFDGRLLSPDDKTGMIYEIRNGKAIPWLFLNSGPGNTTRGMKAEWTTIKGDYLYVGGHGTEYRNENGAILSEEAMWIKIINKHGEIKSVNWKDVYKRVRNAVNITEPGYLTHEAVQWSENQQKWFFLPRKESQTIYSEKDDEMKGSNLLIIGDPHLQHFQAVRIGKLTYPKRGFSAFFFVPGTQDRIIVALKSEEVEGSSPKSYVTVFDINGNILLDDKKLEDDYKFEGIYFI